MSTLLTRANAFKAELLRGDAEALRRLSAAYAASHDYLRTQLDALLREIDRARAEGREVSASWLTRQERFRALLAQVEAEIGKFSGRVEAQTSARQPGLVTLGQEHAAGLLDAAGAVDFVRLPREAVEELVANLREDAPLGELLKRLGPDAGQRVREALVAGLVAGEGPRKVAARFTGALGGLRARALAVARTEGMRAYRNSTQRLYEANGDVLAGWVWLSARTSRTCAACWAMDGTIHPVTETLKGHVCCRCVMVPLTDKAQAEEMGTGGVLFSDLPDEVQAEILGPTRFELFEAGTPLKEFVRLERSKWGGAYVTKPVGQLRKRAA